MQDIELQDMMAIIHGLRMSGLSFVEPDALDEINSRIKDLPSSEALSAVYSDPREVKRLCSEVGRVMELIDHYGTRNEEAKARYKAKTNLPPRYKSLRWKAASKVKTAQEIPQASTEMEAMAQQLKDLESELLVTQQELTTFSNRINSDLPNLSAQVPAQYQPIFQQYAVVVNEAANGLLNKTIMLIQGIQMIQNSTAGIQSVLQENETMMSQFIANSSYIKNIVKLSKNLEGNGIISDKLISYAKKLKNKDIKASYDLLEINALLRHASMSREADILIKTAGIGDALKDGWQSFKGGLGKKKQNIPAGYGLIDPGEQTGSQWETGNLETQFANDVDWLKRSWDNLVDFFGRYVRDASILENEWKGRDDQDKVAKINELKQQAELMLANVQKIQQSKNFSAALMGDNFSSSFGVQSQEPEAEGTEINVGDKYKGLNALSGKFYLIKNIENEYVFYDRYKNGSLEEANKRVTKEEFLKSLKSGNLEFFEGDFAEEASEPEEKIPEEDQTRLDAITKDDVTNFHRYYNKLITLTKKGTTNLNHLTNMLKFLKKIKAKGSRTAGSFNYMIKEAAETIDFSIPFLEKLYKGQWTVGNLDGAILELEKAIETEHKGREAEKGLKSSLDVQMRNYDLTFGEVGFKSKFIYDNFYSGRQRDFVNDLEESMDKKIPLDKDLRSVMAEYNNKFNNNKINTNFIIKNKFDSIDSFVAQLRDSIKRGIPIGSELEKLTNQLESMNPFFMKVRNQILNNQFYGIDFEKLDDLLILLGRWQTLKTAKSKKDQFNLRLAQVVSNTIKSLEDLLGRIGRSINDKDLNSFIRNELLSVDTNNLRGLFSDMSKEIERTRAGTPAAGTPTAGTPTANTYNHRRYIKALRASK